MTDQTDDFFAQQDAEATANVGGVSSEGDEDPEELAREMVRKKEREQPQPVPGQRSR
jgi:hypothetical protein